MSRTEADVVVTFPVKTKLVCSSCGSPGEGTCRCGMPYVTPGARAEAAVQANPEKSDRSIAKELGVSQPTVTRARKKTGDTSVSPEKRKGRDGKLYTAKRKTSADKFTAAVQSRKQGRTQAEAAKEAGLNSVQTVKIAEAYDQGRADQLKELSIDPDTMVLSAQAKLEAAKRAMERKLNAEHAIRMRELNEEVRKRVLAEGKEYLEMLNAKEKKAAETVALYKEWTNNLKPIFTLAEFNTVLKCLDSSAISFRLKAPDPELIKRFDEAMLIVREKRDRLLLVKSK